MRSFALAVLALRAAAFAPAPPRRAAASRARRGVGDAGGGLPPISPNIRDVADEAAIVGLAELVSRPLPNRPGGALVCVAYTADPRGAPPPPPGESEGFAGGLYGGYDGGLAGDVAALEFDQGLSAFAEAMPDVLFLRCCLAYARADACQAARGVSGLPAFELFEGGERVALEQGATLAALEARLAQFGCALAEGGERTDLFSPSGLLGPGAEYAGEALGRGRQKTYARRDAVADAVARVEKTAARAARQGERAKAASRPGGAGPGPEPTGPSPESAEDDVDAMLSAYWASADLDDEPDDGRS